MTLKKKKKKKIDYVTLRLTARVRFNIKKKEFLGLTFREFQDMNTIFSNDKKEHIIALYESMRLQTYFQFSLQASKKHAKSFDQFCKQLMPMQWDEKVVVTAEEVGAIDWAEKDRIYKERAAKPKVKAKIT